MRHFTGHRCQNPRVVEVGFCGIQRRLITLYLRLDGADLRLFHRQIRSRRIQLLAGNQLTLGKLLLASQGDRGKLAFSASLIQLGAQFHQRRVDFFDLVLRLLGVNHPQQLIFLNLVANIHAQRF